MQIFKHIAPLKAFLLEKKKRGEVVGFVPTMGALHEGHMALIRTSINVNSLTVCSIFVNPAQFNNPHDLEHYPRTLTLDTTLLKDVGCDVLFCPEVDELYPTPAAVKFDFGSLDKVMEGAFRPGHFSGVALVVSKLLHIIEPDRAYFGQKDWQQFTIIRKLVTDLNFPVELQVVETTREQDGLAMSSRNKRLSSQHREHATIFFKALNHARDLLRQGHDFPSVKYSVANLVNQVPHVRLEYFELADRVNLIPADHVDTSAGQILCIAGYVGDVRLIDNMFL